MGLGIFKLKKTFLSVVLQNQSWGLHAELYPLFFISETKSHYIAQAGLELVIFLPQPSRVLGSLFFFGVAGDESQSFAPRRQVLYH